MVTGTNNTGRWWIWLTITGGCCHQYEANSKQQWWRTTNNHGQWLMSIMAVAAQMKQALITHRTGCSWQWVWCVTFPSFERRAETCSVCGGMWQVTNPFYTINGQTLTILEALHGRFVPRSASFGNRSPDEQTEQFYQTNSWRIRTCLDGQSWCFSGELLCSTSYHGSWIMCQQVRMAQWMPQWHGQIQCARKSVAMDSAIGSRKGQLRWSSMWMRA